MHNFRLNTYKIFNSKKIIFLIFFILIFITLLTKYYGSSDLADYSDTAKFFAGKYSADVRNSHSYFYGFIFSPLVKLSDSFFLLKVVNLITLALIIFSVYLISNRNGLSLWLMLISPITWYIAPIITPITISALFFLWAWYFIDKYNNTHSISSLFFSGILIGLAWTFWDTIIFFGLFFFISFFFNKKLSHAIYFLFFTLMGLIPRLILDQIIFNFPFYTIFKSTFGTIANGIYLGRGTSYIKDNIILNAFIILQVLITIPIYFWKSFNSNFFRKNKELTLFLSLSLALILINPQIRYLTVLIPIIIVVISNHINFHHFKKQASISIIVILFFISPYLIQINYSLVDNIDGGEFSYLLANPSNIKISTEFPKDVMLEDLQKIIQEYPDSVFIVGNTPDSYRELAHIYWGDKVKEFVSIQDYLLYMNNQTVIFEKKFMPIPNINERRQIWLAGGISRNENDNTNFKEIRLGIGINAPINITGFEEIKKYKVLFLSGKK